MKEKAEASEKKKNADVKRRKGAAAKRRAAIKKKRKPAKRSETPEKKRKRDSGLDGGSSSNPSKRTRNRVRETAASSPEHQGVHDPTPAAELPSQGDSEGTPRPVIPSQPQKSPTPTHAASEAENQQQPRVTSGSSTKSPSHRVDKQNGEEIGSNNRDSNAPEVVVDNDAPRTVERDDMTVEAARPAGFFFKPSDYGKDKDGDGEAEMHGDKEGDEETEMHGDKEGDEETEKHGDKEGDEEGEDNGDKDGDEAEAEKDDTEERFDDDGDEQSTLQIMADTAERFEKAAAEKTAADKTNEVADDDDALEKEGEVGVDVSLEETASV
ncbi:hypothetical protein HID58_046149 [Brassica napus]|uniref:Uncharacterized protein n=1 Tax=Brassica napus TaxID=3708 RepID=A0ABQ8AVM1_BRANA|nr:hypothetical protein HID58_046149 [Brassica napus]